MSNEINAMDIEEAYKTLINEMEIGRKDTETYQQARFGVSLDFDIYDYFEENYQFSGKNHEITIAGKTYTIKDFRTELEMRERVMKDWIKENVDEEQWEIRGIDDE